MVWGGLIIGPYKFLSRLKKLIDTKFFLAEGSSKKDAEQNAAIKCLQNQSKL